LLVAHLGNQLLEAWQTERIVQTTLDDSWANERDLCHSAARNGENKYSNCRNSGKLTHPHGVAAGVTSLLVLGFASNALSVALLYRFPKVLMGHIVSLPLMPVMAHLTLSSIGFAQT
jgi:hypothetical protein